MKEHREIPRARVTVHLRKADIVTRRFGMELEDFMIDSPSGVVIILSREAAEELAADLRTLLDNQEACRG